LSLRIEALADSLIERVRSNQNSKTGEGRKKKKGGNKLSKIHGEVSTAGRSLPLLFPLFGPDFQLLAHRI
jgi:hypothetical protein